MGRRHVKVRVVGRRCRLGAEGKFSFGAGQIRRSALASNDQILAKCSTASRSRLSGVSGNSRPPDPRSINVADDPRFPAPIVLLGQPPAFVAGALSCAVAGAMRSPSPMSTNGAQAKGCEKTSDGPPGEP